MEQSLERIRIAPSNEKSNKYYTNLSSELTFQCVLNGALTSRKYLQLAEFFTILACCGTVRMQL